MLQLDSTDSAMLGSVGSPDMDQALITTASLEVVSARRAVPEWIESMNLPLARKSQLWGSVLGRLYQLEQELFTRLGLVTD